MDVSARPLLTHVGEGCSILSKKERKKEQQQQHHQCDCDG